MSFAASRYFNPQTPRNMPVRDISLDVTRASAGPNAAPFADLDLDQH